MITRISRVVADLDRSVAFYQAAFECREIRRERLNPEIGDGSQVILHLGEEEIALVRFDTPGRAIPAGSRSNDLWFQHLAIVVADIDVAFAHLSAQPGWQKISAGPVLLPPENGSVRACKFRDPDGHPLELIWFPAGQGRALWHTAPGLFRGIDHSALTVSDGAVSEAFYAGLALSRTALSQNRGAAQSALDGLPEADVTVIGLRSVGTDGPGVELLAYHPPGRRGDVAMHDLATDWISLAGTGRTGWLRDPDGHLLRLV